MLKFNGRMYKSVKIRTDYQNGVPRYKLYFFDIGKMGGVGLNGYSYQNRKKVSLKDLREAAAFVFNLSNKKLSLTDEYFMEKYMNKKTIKDAIKRVKTEKNVSQKDKDFLVGWLKDGLDGPDNVCKAEMITQGV